MDPLVKRLLIIGTVGLAATWSTFLALEFTPQDEELEPLAREPAIERRPNVSANKRRDQQRSSRIAAAKRPRPEKKPPLVKRPVINRTEPPQVPQQTAAIEAPKVPDIPPKISAAVNPANPAQVRFNQMKEVYESEVRDSVWADEKEKRILDVFKKGNYEETLVDISCRKTLCRMEVRMDSVEALFRLFELPGLAAEVGTNAASQPLGEGNDKRMVSFILRKGPSR